MSKKGRLIAFEGMDGVGKTTLVDSIHYWLLHDIGIDARKTSALSEHATPHGALIGDLLRNKTWQEIDALAEVLLIAAARRDNWVKLIHPHLQSGGWVISDRHCDSLYCYQRGLDVPLIDNLLFVCDLQQEADLTFLIDLEHDHPRLRRNQNDRLESRADDWWKKCADMFRDRFDEKLEYNKQHNRIVLDGSKSIDELIGIVRGTILTRLMR